MIKIEEKSTCCGCNACGDICAQKAIKFETDMEGFWYPVVDEAKCTNCGLCEKTCPVININNLKKNDLPEAICYAAEHKNLEVVFDSTSGGLFSALADVMYEDNGYVGGAIFNEDFSVRQYISSDKQDLPKLRSSKYLQSNLEGFYKQVKELLQSGEKVLVCGGPCQMVALRAFLGKDYENLIIADYICRGINSPKVWRKYLDTFEERYGSKVVYSKAKSKIYGWRNLTYKTRLANGKYYYETRTQSNFMKGYLQTNVYCRPSCYNCQFKGFPRMADITLADFWGIEKLDKSMEKNLGTSLVMVNSKKGEAYFERVKENINYIQIPFEKAVGAGNAHLKRPLDPPKIDRRQFFEDLDKMSFLKVADKYVNVKVKKSLKRKIKDFLKKIYHAQKLLRQTSLFQALRLNKLTDIFKGRGVYVFPYTVIQKAKTAKISVSGRLLLGPKKFPKSKLETRLMMDEGSELIVKGNFSISYGGDIEIFKGAKLILEGDGYTNINAVIICNKKIQIGDHVRCGRDVTIRDFNGSHYINSNGYKACAPVVIEDNVWLSSGCTIMPGVTVGEGAVVAANAVVTKDVPPHTLVAGVPARIIRENIETKL